MKVLDLQCSNGHGFEGWFASEDDFQGQLARAMVECPICSDTHVIKLLSAPRLNLGAQKRPEPIAAGQKPAASGHQIATTPDMQMQVAWMQMVKHVMANTEDVGERFPEEARRIHYGEVQERGIRGQASREETEALMEEGIGVVPLPIPKALKEPLQ